VIEDGEAESTQVGIVANGPETWTEVGEVGALPNDSYCVCLSPTPVGLKTP